jgi:large subunit ribosomal protein L3
MGFHPRTEYNKKIVKISQQPEEINSKGGIVRYGVVRNTYMMVHGSVAGPEKREVVLTTAYRPNKTVKEAVPELTHISK